MDDLQRNRMIALSSTVIIKKDGKDNLLIVVASDWWGTRAYIQQTYYIVQVES